MQSLSAFVARHHAVYHGAMRLGVRLFEPLFSNAAPTLDLVVVLPDNQRGWILEGIANEVLSRFQGRGAIHGSVRGLPSSAAYFFLHYSTLISAFRHNPVIWRSRVFVWYTHPRDDLAVSESELLYLQKRITRTFTTCSQFRRMLQQRGVEASRLGLVIGGADPAAFRGHARGNGCVGLCTAYYDRKSPDLLTHIVKAMPHRHFLLVGRNWRNYARFQELQAFPNFEYVEAAYAQYPALYDRMDVFLSASRLEGGPIPLIEAMMSNVVPVASRTGFAPDLIRHGDNGFLFDIGSVAATVCPLIDAAFALAADIRSTVVRYSWDNFARDMQREMGFTADKFGAVEPAFRVIHGGPEREIEQ